MNQGSYYEHQKILEKSFLLVSSKFPSARVFARHTGKFILQGFITELKSCGADLHRILATIKGFKRFLISVSLPGQGDAYILFPYKNELIHIELEFKSGNAVQSPEQKNWEKTIISINGLYILVREPEDIIHAIQKKWPEIS